jgi:hypothetical protein
MEQQFEITEYTPPLSSLTRAADSLSTHRRSPPPAPPNTPPLPLRAQRERIHNPLHPRNLGNIPSTYTTQRLQEWGPTYIFDAVTSDAFIRSVPAPAATPDGIVRVRVDPATGGRPFFLRKMFVSALVRCGCGVVERGRTSGDIFPIRKFCGWLVFAPGCKWELMVADRRRVRFVSCSVNSCRAAERVRVPRGLR